MRGLDHSWVPLHLAIAWILTRDRAFVADLPPDGSTRTLAIAVAIAKVGGKKVKRVRDVVAIPNAKVGDTKAKRVRVRRGWLILRDETLTGRVRAQGTPYRRRARGRTTVEIAELRRELLPAEIAEASLRDDNEYSDCLIPKRWHASNVPFFRDIHISRPDLLKAFPPPAPTAKDEAGAIIALTDLLRETPTLLRKQASQQLAAKGFDVSGRAFLNRVWPQARLAAGLDPVGRPGRPAGKDRSS